jgi:hypothetical protein
MQPSRKDFDSSLARSLLRRVASILVVAAVLLSSFHHIACAGDGLLPPSDAALAFSGDGGASQPDGPVGLPMHCHCPCHVTGQTPIAAATGATDMRASAYAAFAENILPALAGLPPFKPPRA